MANFSDILNRIIDILNNENGIFLGIEHDDINFNSYFEQILPQLMNRYNDIHFLLEFSNDLLQRQLTIFHRSVRSALRNNVPSSDVKLWCEDFLQKDGQPGMFPAVWASHFRLEVRGVDTAEGRGTAQLHNPNVPIAAKISIMADRALNTGEDMAQNTRAYLGTIAPTAKYLIIGGYMHTEVAKKLNIKSINIITSSQLPALSYMVKNYQPLQSPSFSLDKIPDYVFYYQEPAQQTGNLAQIPVRTKLDASELNSLPELPACAISYEILEEIKGSSHSIVNKFTDGLIRKYNINVSPNTSAHWGKLLRRAAVNNNLLDIRYCIEVLKININDADQTSTSQRTALHWAAIKQCPAIARYLLLHGANANLADTTPEKKTATDYVHDTTNNDLFAAFSLTPPSPPLVNNQNVNLS